LFGNEELKWYFFWTDTRIENAHEYFWKMKNTRLPIERNAQGFDWLLGIYYIQVIFIYCALYFDLPSVLTPNLSEESKMGRERSQRAGERGGRARRGCLYSKTKTVRYTTGAVPLISPMSVKSQTVTGATRSTSQIDLGLGLGLG